MTEQSARRAWPMHPERFRVVVMLAVFPLLFVLGVILQAAAPAGVAAFIAPTLASVGVFVLFALALRQKVGKNIFGELGFLYLGFIVAYTVVPALGFMAA